MQKSDNLDKWEKLAKIISLIGIPFVLAIIGWMVQNKLSEKTVSKDYVNIAISILTENKKEINPALREWSVDLLNDNSPTKFDKKTLEQLKNGQINFPSFLKDLYGGGSSTGDLTISGNGQFFAVGLESGGLEIWNYTNHKLISKTQGYSGIVTCMTFSPDSKLLYTGGEDSVVNIWDVNSGKLSMKFNVGEMIKGIAIAPDSKTFLISSWDGRITQCENTTGKIIQRININDK